MNVAARSLLTEERACSGVDLLYPAVMPLDSDAAVLVPEVRGLSHAVEQPHLNDPREHLDASEKLDWQRQRRSATCMHGFESAHRVRVLHELLREGRVDDEVAVVGHDGPRLHLRHAQLGRGRADEVQVLEDLLVREGHDLDGDALLELCPACISNRWMTWRGRSLTLVPSMLEFLR